MSILKARVPKVPLRWRRLGRRLFWSEPVQFRWLGILRGHGDCLQNDWDVWLGGYPRSANTFATAAFKLANPNVPFASHFHVPPFIIHGLQLGSQGILLISRPIDAAVPWTLFLDGQIR